MAATKSGGDRHVALLRGINVGGKHKLPMKDLGTLFVEAGCGGVRTYIQSGNVVFTAGAELARSIPASIAAAIARRFGFNVPVVTRTAEELRDVALATRRVRGTRTRDLPALPQRRRAQQADERLVRRAARDHQHGAQLEHGRQAGRACRRLTRVTSRRGRARPSAGTSRAAPRRARSACRRRRSGPWRRTRRSRADPRRDLRCPCRR